MGFKSFWGELDVREESVVATAPPKKDEGTGTGDAPDTSTISTAPVNGDIKVQTDNFQLQTGKTDEEIEADKKKKETEDKTITPPVVNSGDEEEGYEFSEEDISKAYTMLEEEGVIELDENDEFEATTKGLGDVIATTVRKKVDKVINGLPPAVHEYYYHLKNGGSEEGFVPNTQKAVWSEVNLEEDENKEAVLKQFYVNQGMSIEEATEEIEDVKAADKLETKATVAHKALVKLDESRAEDKVKADAKAVKDSEKSRTAEVNQIKTDIDNLDELAGFKLDDERKEEFKAYLFNINPRTNRTQMQENMNNEDRRMTLAFLDFVNYTKADLDKEAKTKLTKDRKKKLVRFADRNVANKSNTQVVKKGEKAKKGKIVFPSIFGAQKIEVED